MNDAKNEPELCKFLVHLKELNVLHILALVRDRNSDKNPLLQRLLSRFDYQLNRVHNRVRSYELLPLFRKVCQFHG